nr:hypothetical protein [Tanacetum cinerariifolium]
SELLERQSGLHVFPAIRSIRPTFGNCARFFRRKIHGTIIGALSDRWFSIDHVPLTWPPIGKWVVVSPHESLDVPFRFLQPICRK